MFTRNLKVKVTRNLKVKAAAAAALATVGAAAQAAPMTLPTEVSDALVSVGVIGAGVFAIYVGIKLYKWVRGAL